jgi:hypothetical protein
VSAETFVATFGRFSTSWDLSAQMYDADGVAVGDALTDWQELGGGRYMLYAEDVPSSARVIVVSESTYGVVQVGPVEAVGAARYPATRRPFIYRAGPRMIGGT